MGRNPQIFVKTFLYAILIIFQLAVCEHTPKLLLISFDGFRWDYLSKTDTPNFDRITNNGVRAKWIKDSFTSLTFPNHYTIATGLYEESHGIVANIFYDPVFNETFQIGNETTVLDGKFWGGEPIWVTNQLQGGRTGVYYWPGSEAEIKGVRPNIYEKYIQQEVSMALWRNRTDTVIEWLTDPENVVDLALLYFKEPDHTGHIYGPESPEVVQMIQQCDNITGYILDQIEEHGLSNLLNIIITSDHGMTGMNRSRFITLDDHIDTHQTKHLINYIVGTSVWPKSGENITEELYKNLSSIDPEHVQVWMKKDIPPEYHYANNRRIAPILMSANEGWGIKENWNDTHYLLGRHGFNNSKMDMHPFFVATGPVFKKGFISEPFENVNIYSLMCHILGINPAPNNGSLDAVKQLLADEYIPDEEYKYTQLQFTIAKWAGICFGAIIVIVLLIYVIKELKMNSQMRKEVSGFSNSNLKYSERDENREPLLSTDFP
uniref:ectonucleotide pyrophosphatase/phosphodiesterase family member 5-like n=1 Tax=Styela clava TaxID=7725 RepID=UPI00193AC813|nr:ectonucleotide pyrophosphatase/phosphodiesterase family member 5-like [Styela clava]